MARYMNMDANLSSLDLQITVMYFTLYVEILDKNRQYPKIRRNL